MLHDASGPSAVCCDESIDFLRASLDTAKAAGKEKLEGLRRLERFARAVEARLQPEADFEAAAAHENAISSALGGRSVFDNKHKRRASNSSQGSLI